jgi:FMN phosphatase YigB (HAD superfamily)
MKAIMFDLDGVLLNSSEANISQAKIFERTGSVRKVMQK